MVGSMDPIDVDVGVVIFLSDSANADFPCHLCILFSLFYGEVSCSAAHRNIIPDAIVKVEEEERLEPLVFLFQPGHMATLKIGGPQAVEECSR